MRFKYSSNLLKSLRCSSQPWSALVYFVHCLFNVALFWVNSAKICKFRGENWKIALYREKSIKNVHLFGLKLPPSHIFSHPPTNIWQNIGILEQLLSVQCQCHLASLIVLCQVHTFSKINSIFFLPSQLINQVYLERLTRR